MIFNENMVQVHIYLEIKCISVKRWKNVEWIQYCPNTFAHIRYDWVLVNVPRGSYPQSHSAHIRMADKGGSLDVGCQVITGKA